MITWIRFNKIEGFEAGIEIETFVDSIDVSSGGKEVTLNIQTQIDNNSTFYTDSAGLEMLERKINFRPTWKLDPHQYAAGNYYPINSAISIESVTNKKKMT